MIQKYCRWRAWTRQERHARLPETVTAPAAPAAHVQLHTHANKQNTHHTHTSTQRAARTIIFSSYCPPPAAPNVAETGNAQTWLKRATPTSAAFVQASERGVGNSAEPGSGRQPAREGEVVVFTNLSLVRGKMGSGAARGDGADAGARGGRAGGTLQRHKGCAGSAPRCAAPPILLCAVAPRPTNVFFPRTRSRLDLRTSIPSTSSMSACTTRMRILL